MPSKLEQLKKEIKRLRPEIEQGWTTTEIIEKLSGKEIYRSKSVKGRPITLEDVLAVLYLDDEDYRPDVNIGWKKDVGECFLFTFNEKMYVWEYGKPLDDQSEETINFLHSLIVK